LLVDDVLECLSNKIPVVGGDDELSNHGEEYSTMTVESSQLGGICGHPSVRPTGDCNQNGIDRSADIVIVHGCSDSDRASDEHDANLPNDNVILPGIAPPPAKNHQ